MGMAITLEVSHSSEYDFARALRPLAVFGLVHGSHEWFEMFLLIRERSGAVTEPVWVTPVRIVILAASFVMLVAFGVNLIIGLNRPRLKSGMILVAIVLWGLGLLGLLSSQIPANSLPVAIDVYTRYSLAIPGGALTAWGLILQRRKFLRAGMHSFGRDVSLAALAFGMYGGIGQLFASPSAIFPSGFLNAEVFLNLFGFPVQVFRAAMACFAAIFIIRSLRAFEVETLRRINALREAQLAEQRRLEELRAELLHRTVIAQESERQRIARELHDETGQTLTALGMGLRGLSETTARDPERAVQQAKQLETLAAAGMGELQRMVAGLHPPQLDDLGLIPALRWYTWEITKLYGLQINVGSQGTSRELSPDVRIVLFRIAQEAITNAVKHANANQVDLKLTFSDGQVNMLMVDDGDGFDVEAVMKGGPERASCWGLLGMLERATLVGGTCTISSTSREGTRVEVTVPVKEN